MIGCPGGPWPRRIDRAAAHAAELTIEPHLPPDWVWLHVRNLPYQGTAVSFFVYEGRLHTARPVESPLPQVVY